MPRPRDLLQRFRLAGTPGAAAAPGVPADRVAELSAELGPLLARLDSTCAEADRVRAAAQDEAQRRRHRAEERARAEVAAARSDADAERADAAARVRRHADEERDRMLTEAEREAAGISHRAADRMPEYVDRVVAEVRDAVLTGGAHGPSEETP